MKKTTIVLLVLALAMLMSACAMPGVAPTPEESIPTNLEKGNNYNADMKDLNNTNESAARIWPWEDPSIVLPPFTGEVTEYGSIKSLKIVAIGDASARDAWQFFPQIAKEAGIELKLTVLYCNGDLNSHNSTGTSYTHIENTGNGWVTVSTNAKRLDVLQSEAWDYCIVNQSIANSGLSNTYGALSLLLRSNLLATVSKNRDVKHLFMQTWAYEVNDRNNLFNGFKAYGTDQQKMYADINSTVKSKVITCSNLSKVAANANKDGVIPVGTAVQNMRESYWSDGLTRDSEFLSTTGKVLAAVMLFKSITGYDVNGLELSDPVFDHARPHLGVIKESVNNAYLKPYETTDSVYHMD